MKNINKKRYFNSWLMAIILYPLIAIIGAICQIYTYDRFDSFFMAGFILHGYLVLAHPFAKYTLKSVIYVYIAGTLGAMLGYLNESNSIVIALLVSMSALHFTSTPTKEFEKFDKLSLKEQRQARSIKWLKSMLIGIIALFLAANFMNTIKTILSNNIIEEKFEKCHTKEFTLYKNKDAIAIAKCYNDKKQLEYIGHYFLSGEIDDVYYFKNNNLSEIYDFRLGHNTHYLQYKFDNIVKQKEQNIYKSIRTYYKYNSNKIIKEKAEVSIDYIEDEITIYKQNGLQVYYKKGILKEDVASIYKNNKLHSSKELTKEEIKLFK